MRMMKTSEAGAVRLIDQEVRDQLVVEEAPRSPPNGVWNSRTRISTVSTGVGNRALNWPASCQSSSSRSRDVHLATRSRRRNGEHGVRRRWAVWWLVVALVMFSNGGCPRPA